MTGNRTVAEPTNRSPRDVYIRCADGTTLAGKLYEPDVPQLAVVIHGATAVPQTFYAPFAQWLSETRNAAVLTYDYRDYGASATGPVKHAKATMAMWGVEDQGAALDFMCERYSALPIEGIGHSMGGLFLAFHRQAGRMRRFTAVASGLAHWTRHPWFFTPAVIAFWFAAGPLLTRLFGYMPGRRIGLGSDVPAGVYWQWRRWCMAPQKQFHRMDWGRTLPQPDPRAVNCPLALVAISDDPMIPPAIVRELAQLYPYARAENWVISPADAGTKAIGHVRIFSEACRSAWPLLAG